MKYRISILHAITAMSAIMVGTASAQATSMAGQEKELSVLTRQNPAYDRAGLRFAGLILNADLTNSIEYRDNLYFKETNKTKDFIHKIRPSLELKSDFTRHFLSVAFGAEKGLYKQNTDENYLDYNMRISARADVSSNITLPISAEYRKSHSQRSDPEDRNEVQPTLYNELILNAGIGYRGANADLLINTNIKNIKFENNRTLTSFIDNSDRNRSEFLVSADLGFAKNRAISPFIFANLGEIKYDRRTDDNGLKRSSKSFIGGLGVNISPSSSLINATIRIGKINRSFDDTSFSDINDLIYSANVTWDTSPMLAIDFSGERKITESTLGNFSASVDDLISASAYYELMPNIFLNPKISYVVKNYRGDIDRTLKRTSGNMSVIYKINKNIWVSGNYNHMRQSEDENNVDLGTFNSNLYNISMKLQI